MIDRRWLIDPTRVISIIFCIQFILWFVFFPDTPTVATGEPKSRDLFAQVFFFILLLLFLISIGIGRASVAVSYIQRSYSVAEYRYFYNLGIISFWISTVAMIIQLRLFIFNPRLILLLQQPYGQNQLARMMHEDSMAGIPTLSWLMPIAIGIFSLYWFTLPVSNKWRRSSIKYTLSSLLFLLAYSIVGMSRQSLFVGVILFGGAWSMGRTRRIKVLPTVFATLAMTIFVFIGAAVRMAGIDGAFSGEVYSLVWSEFVEKYLPGELNNTFIMLSYTTDITRNWLYATMFDRFASDSFSPARYLNTLNSLALWYWQFGWFSFFVTIVIGLLIGRLYRNAELLQFTPSWPSFFYLISLPAIYTMVRVNAFFLAYFLTPFVFLLAAQCIWVLLRIHTSRQVSLTRGWKVIRNTTLKGRLNRSII